MVGLGQSFKNTRLDLDRKIWQSAHLCYWPVFDRCINFRLPCKSNTWIVNVPDLTVSKIMVFLVHCYNYMPTSASDRNGWFPVVDATLSYRCMSIAFTALHTRLWSFHYRLTVTYSIPSNCMAAQHLPWDLVQLNRGLRELAQTMKKYTVRFSAECYISVYCSAVSCSVTVCCTTPLSLLRTAAHFAPPDRLQQSVSARREWQPHELHAACFLFVLRISGLGKRVKQKSHWKKNKNKCEPQNQFVVSNTVH